MLKQLKALFLLFMLMPMLSVGQNWGTPVAVAPANTSGTDLHLGYQTKMLVVNGRPAIVSYEAQTRCLFYMRANDASGTSWGTPRQGRWELPIWLRHCKWLPGSNLYRIQYSQILPR